MYYVVKGEKNKPNKIVSLLKMICIICERNFSTCVILFYVRDVYEPLL